MMSDDAMHALKFNILMFILCYIYKQLHQEEWDISDQMKDGV